MSLCGMGLWQAENVKKATTGLSSCQPWVACARKSLHWSSVPLRTAALWEGLARKHGLFHWGPLGLEDPGLLSFSTGLPLPSPHGFLLVYRPCPALVLRLGSWSNPGVRKCLT